GSGGDYWGSGGRATKTPPYTGAVVGYSAPGRSLLRRHLFELVLAHLDVGGPGLLPDADAVDAGTARPQGAAELDDLHGAVAGVADLDERANLQGLGGIFHGHRLVLRVRASPGRCAEDKVQRIIHGAVEP